MKDLSGQVAIVTGGGRGIGRAIALGLAKAGCSVAVVARSEDQQAETVRQITQLGSRALPVAADVSDPGAVERMVRVVDASLGSVDLLVNNAGLPGPIGPTWEVDSSPSGMMWPDWLSGLVTRVLMTCRRSG